MPFASDKQRKAMYAAAAGKSRIGISRAGARKFIKHSGGKMTNEECRGRGKCKGGGSY